MLSVDGSTCVERSSIVCEKCIFLCMRSAGCSVKRRWSQDIEISDKGAVRERFLSGAEQERALYHRSCKGAGAVSSILNAAVRRRTDVRVREFARDAHQRRFLLR